MRVDLSKLITQKEAAEIRGCSPQAINQLVHRGSLKTVVIGGRRLVFRDEVEQFKPSVGGRPKGKITKKHPRKAKREQTEKQRERFGARPDLPFDRTELPQAAEPAGEYVEESDTED